MNDCISRQAAIDALMPIYKSASLRNRNVFSTARKCMAVIEEIPSAQPERKKGKWIKQDDGGDGIYYECSVCKDAFILIDGTPSDNNYNFCPNCGADMREGEEE